MLPDQINQSLLRVETRPFYGVLLNRSLIFVRSGGDEGHVHQADLSTCCVLGAQHVQKCLHFCYTSAGRWNRASAFVKVRTLHRPMISVGLVGAI